MTIGKEEARKLLDIFEGDEVQAVDKEQLADNFSAVMECASEHIGNNEKTYIKAMGAIVRCGGFDDKLSQGMLSSVYIASSVIQVYLKSLRASEAVNDFETVIGGFLQRTDLAKEYKNDAFRVLMQRVFVDARVSDHVRESMLLKAVVVEDLYKENKDLKPYLGFLLHQVCENPELIKPLLARYEPELMKHIKTYIDDLASHREILETLFIHYPSLCSQISSKDFVTLINGGASEAFIGQVLAYMALPDSSAEQSNSIRALITKCLHRVTNDVFFEKLFQDEALLNMACKTHLQPQVVLVQNGVLRKFLKEDKNREKLPKIWQDINLDKIEAKLQGPSHSSRAKGLGGKSEGSGYGSRIIEFDGTEVISNSQ